MKEYIEREALLNSFEELMNIACEQGSPRIGKAMRTGTCAGIAFCRNEVRHAPAADVVEVRHGRWLLERTPDGKPYCFHCSVCDDDFHHIGIMTVYDYCPNCGAYMMGESNGKCE